MKLDELFEASVRSDRSVDPSQLKSVAGVVENTLETLFTALMSARFTKPS